MTAEKKSINFHWEILVTAIFMSGTILGVTIPLHLSIQQDMRIVQQEMKDFHGRMEKIDAEFKAHLMYEHTKDK